MTDDTSSLRRPSGDSDDFREPHLRAADFLGAFGVLRRDGAILMCQNRRVIGGRDVLTWDLPGGQVEPGEMLHETLARELYEELCIELTATASFLFVQEGERVDGAVRRHGWRSFFFAVEEWRGEPAPGSEIVAVRWMEPAAVQAALTAPYHDSFREWLRAPQPFFRSRWAEP